MMPLAPLQVLTDFYLRETPFIGGLTPCIADYSVALPLLCPAGPPRNNPPQKQASPWKNHSSDLFPVFLIRNDNKCQVPTDNKCFKQIFAFLSGTGFILTNENVK